MTLGQNAGGDIYNVHPTAVLRCRVWEGGNTSWDEMFRSHKAYHELNKWVT